MSQSMLCFGVSRASEPRESVRTFGWKREKWSCGWGARAAERGGQCRAPVRRWGAQLGGGLVGNRAAGSEQREAPNSDHSNAKKNQNRHVRSLATLHCWSRLFWHARATRRLQGLPGTNKLDRIGFLEHQKEKRSAQHKVLSGGGCASQLTSRAGRGRGAGRHRRGAGL